MQILLTNQFVTFEYHAEKSLLYYYWTIESQKVKWEDFRSVMEKYKDFIIKYKPQYILADFKDFLYIVTDTEQKWIDKEINGTAFENGLQKLAFVIPNDTYTHISVELVMMETKASLLNYSFFTSLEKAKKWLYE